MHVSEIGLLTAADRQIWNKAKQLRAVVVTKDEDFVTMRHRAGNGPSVIWIRVGNTSNRALTSMLGAALPEIVAAIEKGEAIIEIR